MLVSLRRIGIALLFDWTVGIAFGIMIGWFPKLRAFFSPLFDAVRAVPPLAWIPLITLWFGTGETPKIVIVIFGSIASIVVNVKAGLSTVDKMYLDVGTVFNATPAQRLLKIAIPSSLDAIFAGVRTSTSAAWMVVLAAEMLGAGDAGVGFLISRGMDSMDMPLVLIPVGIIYIAETMSDIIQVGYFKATHGKRFFKMAPLHHHLELSGWSEAKLVAVFSGITLVCCVLAYLGVQGRY